jgi:hypothetical protein
MKYNINDINIGDQVYFKMPYVNNYDLYWVVVEKDESNELLQLEINEMAANDSQFVHIKYINNHMPLNP